MPRRNQDKADYVAWWMRHAPHPGDRVGEDARRYYQSRWNRADKVQSMQDAVNERALQAQENADEEDEEDEEVGDDQGEGEGDEDGSHEDGGTSSDAGAAGPAHPQVGGKGPIRPTVGGKSIAQFEAIIRNELASVEEQLRNQATAADQGHAEDDGANSADGQQSPDASNSPTQRPQLGGKRPPGQAVQPPGAPTKRPQYGDKHPPQAKKPARGRSSSPIEISSGSDDEAESDDSNSSTGSDLIHLELSLNKLDDKRRYEKFTKEHPPFTDGGVWGPGWQASGSLLGMGGGGTVYVHRKLENGRFVDRVAVKDSIVQVSEWTAFETWHGDVRNVETRQHMEIHCLDSITKAKGTKNTLHLRGHEVNNERMWYRIYTCFCAYGDLFDLINRDDTHPKVDIPEPAIWSIFNDPVNARLVLQYGAVEQDKAKEGWIPIVHRDLKDGNVFLDMREDDDGEFPNYPRARIGDFGMATRTTEDDPHNPYAYMLAGTPGWAPLELCRLKSRRTFVPVKGYKVGEKTNVWGIGAIIIRLMSRDNEAAQPLYMDGGVIRETAEQGQPLFIKNGDTDVYSKQLRTLAQKCVIFRPRQRPTLRHLQEEILRYTSGDEDLASGMRTGVKEVREEHKLRHRAEKDEYKIHFAAGAKRQKLR